MNVITRPITEVHMLRLTEDESLDPGYWCRVEVVRLLSGGKERVMATGYAPTFAEAMMDMEKYWAQLFDATRKELALALMEMQQDREEAVRG